MKRKWAYADENSIITIDVRGILCSKEEADREIVKRCKEKYNCDASDVEILFTTEDTFRNKALSARVIITKHTINSDVLQ